MNDPVEWAKSVAAIVKDYCGRTIEPVLARLTAIEQRQPEKGEPGKSVTVEEVTPIIEQAVSQAVSKIPTSKDGRDGIDGKDADVDEIYRRIDTKIAAAIEALPKAKDGVRGPGVLVGVGPPTADGASGDTYIDVETGDIYRCS